MGPAGFDVRVHPAVWQSDSGKLLEDFEDMGTLAVLLSLQLPLAKVFHSLAGASKPEPFCVVVAQFLLIVFVHLAVGGGKECLNSFGCLSENGLGKAIQGSGLYVSRCVASHPSMEFLEKLLGCVCLLLVICEDWDRLIGNEAR